MTIGELKNLLSKYDDATTEVLVYDRGGYVKVTCAVEAFMHDDRWQTANESKITKTTEAVVLCDWHGGNQES